ncbi:signal peptidase II [Mesorhizobium sp. VNQ89]|jgi:signal peptidase II|uniref:signal peptidase II n=1 Tax=Mesorhizobium quangtriensis TaxID=3157709 RepID=UPI0032B73D01
MSRRFSPSNLFLGSLFVLAAFSFDQLTKTIIADIVMQPPRVIVITGFLNIILSYNEGVSFGLFSEILRGRPEILVFTSSVIVAGLLVWMSIAGGRLEAAGLGLMAGGASGNIFDRMERGKVTDFIDFHLAEWHWPAFNLADVAIVVGALILVSGSFLSPQQDVIGK